MSKKCTGGERRREVRDFMDKTKNIDITKELKRAEPELERDGETKMSNIDNNLGNDQLEADDIIALEDGNTTTLREEAAKAKVTVEDFVKRYNELFNSIRPREYNGDHC